MSDTKPGGYAGEVASLDAWKELSATPNAVLVDVRTQAEWTYVGVPDLSPIGKQVVLVSWDAFPTGPIPDFGQRLKQALDARGVAADAPVFFICRSGARSRNAAIAATEAGYGKAFNVTEGFEGALDGERHRATARSWKGGGLPWVQS
jgi:rhodanese-related sulfurtransferase